MGMNTLFNSRIHSKEVSKKETIIGYLFAPQGAMILNSIVAGFINLFYTDVLHLTLVWGGVFIVLLPILSKIVTAMFHLYFGHVIDKTKSPHGKARPWILVSAPLLSFTAVLLFWIPNFDQTGQLIWILISYNLFFSFASSIYMMSHDLMVPLSTRDIQKRNSLSIISSIGRNFISGLFSAVLFALFILPQLQKDHSLWFPVISIFAAVAIPLTLLEYWFTLERITIEHRENSSVQDIPYSKQIKSLLKNKYWIMLMIFLLINTFISSLRNGSIIYYSNWVLGTYETGTRILALIQMVGGFPMGIGVLLIKPLLKYMSKRKLVMIGMVFALTGNIISFIFARNVTLVIIGQIIMSTGTIPSAYIFMSMFADVLDYGEMQNGFRSDGIAISINGVLRTVFGGLAIGTLNLMLIMNNYIAPDNNLLVQIPQSEGMQKAFIYMFSGIPILGQIALYILLYFFTVEHNLSKQKLQQN